VLISALLHLLRDPEVPGGNQTTRKGTEPPGLHEAGPTEPARVAAALPREHPETASAARSLLPEDAPLSPIRTGAEVDGFLRALRWMVAEPPKHALDIFE
jgi:hypothetical protein